MELNAWMRGTVQANKFKKTECLEAIVYFGTGTVPQCIIYFHEWKNLYSLRSAKYKHNYLLI